MDYNEQEYQMAEEEIKDYCDMCEQEKPTGYEFNGDYICKSCYEGLSDRAELRDESWRQEVVDEAIGGGN